MKTLTIAVLLLVSLAACGDSVRMTKQDAADAYAIAACTFMYDGCTSAPAYFDSCMIQVPVLFCDRGDCDRGLSASEQRLVDQCLDAIDAATCGSDRPVIPAQCAELSRL